MGGAAVLACRHATIDDETPSGPRFVRECISLVFVLRCVHGIVFRGHRSNGLRDPWHGGGFLKPGSPASGNHWLLMPNGAHHVDLRAPHPQVPYTYMLHLRSIQSFLQANPTLSVNPTLTNPRSNACMRLP